MFSRTVFCSWKQKTPKTRLVERVVFVFIVPRVLKMTLFREQQNVVFPVFFIVYRTKLNKKNHLFSVFFFFLPVFISSPAQSRRLFFPFLSFDSRFVKFKSNGTIAKRPLKRIQKTQGAKENPSLIRFPGKFILVWFPRKSKQKP